MTEASTARGSRTRTIVGSPNAAPRSIARGVCRWWAIDSVSPCVCSSATYEYEFADRAIPSMTRSVFRVTR